MHIRDNHVWAWRLHFLTLVWTDSFLWVCDKYIPMEGWCWHSWTWKQLTLDFSWYTLPKSSGDSTSWLPFLIHKLLVPTGWYPGLCLDVFVQSLGRRILKIFHSPSTPSQNKIQNFKVKLWLTISVSFTTTAKTSLTMKHKRFIFFPLRTWFSLAHS